MPTRVCATCGRLWSSAVRRRFGERCPECEADAALPPAASPRFAPVSSSPGRTADAATPADRPADPARGDTLAR